MPIDGVRVEPVETGTPVFHERAEAFALRQAQGERLRKGLKLAHMPWMGEGAGEGVSGIRE